MRYPKIINSKKTKIENVIAFTSGVPSKKEEINMTRETVVETSTIGRRDRATTLSLLILIYKGTIKMEKIDKR